MSGREPNLKAVLAALSELRVSVIGSEFDLHDYMERILISKGLRYVREYRLAPRNRIDFMVEGGIGIEVKKGKPNQAQVIAQLSRYSNFPQVSALVLVVERSLDIPRELSGKPCHSFGLNKLWGIAI